MKTTDIKVGERDAHDEKIEAVYAVTSDYAIYRAGDKIRLYCDDDDLQFEDRIFHHRYMEIAPLLAETYAMMPKQLWRVESINRQLARGIAQALQGDKERSIEIISSTMKRLKQRRRLNGQFQYHIGSLLCLLMVFIIVMLSWITNVNNASELSGTFLLYALISMCGALGGYLSLATGIKRLFIDPESGIVLNGFAGATRILIAVAASIFSYFAVVSGMILAPLNIKDSQFALYCVAFLAGFSEKFVPNVLQEIEKSTFSEKHGHKY